MAKKSDYPVFEPFNPLDKRHLGTSVANALLESDTYPLPPEPVSYTHLDVYKRQE